jgi:uncharacterized integral membrane protein
MNKIVLAVLLLIAAALIAYNSTKLDFEELFEGDSLIAVIGILAAVCSGMLLIIFHLSKKIQKKLNE